MSQNEDDLLKIKSKSKEIISGHEDIEWKDGWAPSQPAVGRHLLKFSDDTQVGVLGLDHIMAQLFSEGWKATESAAEEIIERLENEKNYIPSNERVRREYNYALLREYRKYTKKRSA